MYYYLFQPDLFVTGLLKVFRSNSTYNKIVQKDLIRVEFKIIEQNTKKLQT